MDNIVVIDGVANSAIEAIGLCGSELVAQGFVFDAFTKECIEREKKFPTGIINSTPFALPHAKSDFIAADSLCLLRLAKPVAFNRMDDVDSKVLTHLVFNMAIKKPDNHLIFLQKFIALAQKGVFLEQCIKLPLAEVRKLLVNEFSFLT